MVSVLVDTAGGEGGAGVGAEMGDAVVVVSGDTTVVTGVDNLFFFGLPTESMQ